MLTLEAAPVRESPSAATGEQTQTTIRMIRYYLRHLVAIGLEMTAMTRVPTLDWPSDLFADARVGVTL